MRISVEDGKYTYVFKPNGEAEVLRHGEPWKDATGDKFLYCMAAEIENLRAATTLTPCYVCHTPAVLSPRSRCVKCEYERSIANEKENEELRIENEVLREVARSAAAIGLHKLPERDGECKCSQCAMVREARSALKHGEPE